MAVSPVMRPTLLPNLRRLWRDASTVQLGTDPAGAVVLQLRRPELARVLDLLDGARTEPAVLAAGEALGLDPGGGARPRADRCATSGLVVAAHALVPVGLPERVHRRLSVEAAAIAAAAAHRAPHPGDRGPRRRAAPPVRRPRRRRRDGPLAAPVAAALLAASGVGHVDPVVDGSPAPPDVLVGGLHADDVGVSGAVATGNAVARFAPGADPSAARMRRRRPRGAHRRPAPARARQRGLRLAGLPRLELTVRLGTVLVGPLVRPPARPCRTAWSCTGATATRSGRCSPRSWPRRRPATGSRARSATAARRGRVRRRRGARVPRRAVAADRGGDRRDRPAPAS